MPEFTESETAQLLDNVDAILDDTNDVEVVERPDWHAGAGRKGAVRVHELIRKGRLYEAERGLKAGRQRLRQLIELGKLYEAEHGEASAAKHSGRLNNMARGELLATLLQCLARMAKPSFRDEIDRLIEAHETNQTSKGSENA